MIFACKNHLLFQNFHIFPFFLADVPKWSCPRCNLNFAVLSFDKYVHFNERTKFDSALGPCLQIRRFIQKFFFFFFQKLFKWKSCTFSFGETFWFKFDISSNACARLESIWTFVNCLPCSSSAPPSINYAPLTTFGHRRHRILVPWHNS